VFAKERKKDLLGGAAAFAEVLPTKKFAALVGNI